MFKHPDWKSIQAHIKSLQQGEVIEQQRAEEALYRWGVLQKIVGSIVLKKGGGTQEQYQTVLHDSFIDLVDALKKDQFRGDAKITSYFYTIAFRAFLKEKKQHWSIAMSDLSPEWPDEEAIRPDEYAILESIRKYSSPDCMKIFAWSSENYVDEEIAPLLNFKNADVVKKTRYECRKKLRQWLEENHKGWWKHFKERYKL
jgi:DNA-directed RNA polymerase specialized sigma24 family protein